MIRLSKLADYAVVMLSYMAAREGEVYTTARLAQRALGGLPSRLGDIVADDFHRDDAQRRRLRDAGRGK